MGDSSMGHSPTIPSRSEVVAAYPVEAGDHEPHGIAYNDDLWTKYGRYVTVAEADMQRYVASKADKSIVRVPAIYDAWTVETPGAGSATYIIMENISEMDFVDFKEGHPDTWEDMLPAIEQAVRHIWALPPPPSIAIGSLDPETAVNRVFGDCGVDRTFGSVAELEDWLNSNLERGRWEERVNLRDETPHICHGDLTQYNIKIGQTPTILDWGFAGIWPRVFEEYGLLHQFGGRGMVFAKALNKQLFGDEFSENLKAVSRAANVHQFGVSRRRP